ncbi:hypothetical protein [Acaryochloris marina]|uniref:Uncharacterized protein n=1 Tax=Acaryochloris marina (strain MBIC 11017) TaxID=329726 RepID=B0C9J6_ACAM1|nr:hypothetical protein [Acaryochloris marina]ABW29009.1 conserved hypothetical protein [Acaryochloris marina MBIC11017]BDM77976.1 hypothetical protein AM10699_08460 [Acaryochloris marina MBIC10699]
MKTQRKFLFLKPSDWAERGSYQTCGIHLLYRLKEKQQYFVPVSWFTNSKEFLFDHQVFIDEKPALYSLANKIHGMTGAQLLAQFTSSEV